MKLKYQSLNLYAVVVVVHLIAPSQSWATIDDLMTEDDLFAEIPTVTSATRLEQKLSQIPAAVTIIDRRMIEASGAVNIADLFKLVPGFQSYQVHANKFGVTSHGQGDNDPGRLEVTIDGRSVYLPALSSVDWSAVGISLNDINHIEVVRGPSVATHGSNAFLGAIHITTRSAVQDQGTAIQLGGGALEGQDHWLRYSDSIGGLNYRISANYHQNEGTGYGFIDGNPALSSHRMEDGAELSQLNLSGVYTPSLRDSLSFQLGVSDGWIGVGNPTDPADFTRRKVAIDYQNLSWTRQLDNGDELKLQGYRNHQDYDNHNIMLLSEFASIEFGFPVPPAAIPGFTDGAPDQLIDLGQDTGVAERYDLELQYNASLPHQMRLIAGAGMRQDAIRGRPLFGHGDTIRQELYRLFGNLEWQSDFDVTTNIGAMIEHDQVVGARVSPRLGLNWQLAPQHSVRAAATLAYRMPSILEQQRYGVLQVPSNGAVIDLDSYTPTQIDPERIRAYELGYLHQAPQINSLFDVKLYVEQVDRSIADYMADAPVGVELPIGDQIAFELRNTAQWQTRGVEVQWQLQPWDSSWWFISYAYAEAEGEHQRGQRGIQSLDERVPSHDLSVLLSQQLGQGWEASMGFYRQAAVYWFKGSDLDLYNRVDARLAKRFGNARINAKIELILQSFNAPYTEFEDNNTVDNRGFVRLTLDFL